MVWSQFYLRTLQMNRMTRAPTEVGAQLLLRVYLRSNRLVAALSLRRLYHPGPPWILYAGCTWNVLTNDLDDFSGFLRGSVSISHGRFVLPRLRLALSAVLVPNRMLPWQKATTIRREGFAGCQWRSRKRSLH